MTTKTMYNYALEKANEVVEHVRREQMELPTPDDEWNVHDLLQHMVYELAWTADIVAGRTISEVGDKYESILLHGNPVELWRHFEPRTRAAVETCDEQARAHLSYADKAVGEYLLEAGNDQLVHAWDLGQAIGVRVVFDEEVAELLYEQASARKDEYASSGLFADPLSVSDSESAQIKLLALLGRSEHWAAKI